MKKCAVCMPLVDEMRELFEAIRTAIYDSLGSYWTCVRADNPLRPGMIDEKSVHFLLNADLVIAVIADPRETNAPNVMYELGIAHSFRKPTIVVADSSRTKLPPDAQGVENLLLIDFSGPDTALELRRTLQHSLREPGVVAELERKRLARNPITKQLSGTHIFLEDFSWALGDAEVLKRERAATTAWEITSDLFWAGEPMLFASFAESIHLRRKNYFMIMEDADILRRAETIKEELHALGFTQGTINDSVHFVVVECRYFSLLPTAIVLYDANIPNRRSGIICEPMQTPNGNDPCRSFRSKPLGQFGPDLMSFEKCLLDLDWTDRRREATFDIALNGRVVEKLAASFTQIWNEKIVEEAQRMDGDEKSTLLSNWLIGGIFEG